ncbi:collagen alpha-1(XXV) chain [Ambystoma mexicanum]|uniref:collagen alpha-1(XXV) chain n=1 Tax=Ambystoma mexicanum TaxID=8296 RepID=UPI0037E91BA2
MLLLAAVEGGGVPAKVSPARGAPSPLPTAWALLASCCLCLACFAGCLYLTLSAGSMLGTAPPRGQHWEPGEQLRALVREQVERLLAQRTYEDHAAKVRIAREAASMECNCSAGPPGKRGKRGRRGETAYYISDFYRLQTCS